MQDGFLFLEQLKPLSFFYGSSSAIHYMRKKIKVRLQLNIVVFASHSRLRKYVFKSFI